MRHHQKIDWEGEDEGEGGRKAVKGSADLESHLPGLAALGVLRQLYRVVGGWCEDGG